MPSGFNRFLRVTPEHHNYCIIYKSIMRITYRTEEVIMKFQNICKIGGAMPMCSPAYNRENLFDTTINQLSCFMDLKAQSVAMAIDNHIQTVVTDASTCYRQLPLLTSSQSLRYWLTRGFSTSSYHYDKLDLQQ